MNAESFEYLVRVCNKANLSFDLDHNPVCACFHKDNPTFSGSWAECCFENCPVVKQINDLKSLEENSKLLRSPLTLMELEELCDEYVEGIIGAPVWIQDKFPTHLTCATLDRSHKYNYDVVVVWTADPEGIDWYKLKDYGRKWVAWKEIPTKKEIGNVRWAK